MPLFKPVKLIGWMFIVLLCTAPKIRAQTTLAAGEIAIVGFNFDNDDEFSFVLLTNIASGTQIKFTDNGWLGAGGFRGGEGTYTWTAGSALTCGTEITINCTTGTASTGSLSGTAPNFSATGDQILAYQGADATPTFIYALNSEGTGWQADATSSNTSAIPTGLTDGTNAIALNEIDNAIYDCSTTTPAAAILAAVSNTANWSGSDGTRQTLPIACGFSCAACTPDSEPTTAASNLSFSGIGCNAFTINWTSGNGANRIVVVSTAAITGDPADQTAYTANATFGSGDILNAGEYVVYNGNGTSVAVTGLTTGTTYYVEIFEFNGVTANCTENYLVSTTLTGSQATQTASEPTTNASALNFTSVGCNSFTVNWTNGNGANRIVVMSTSVIAGTPSDATDYTANSAFGSGSTIAAGEFVVYNGSGSSVAVTGLNPVTTYYVTIYEYNGTTANCDENYLITSPLNGNQATQTASEPTTNANTLTFSNLNCTSYAVNWNNGNGANRIVVISSSAIAGTPTDATDYSANSVFGSGSTIAAGEFVAYNGNGSTVTITGLTAGTTYYVSIFEYNGTTADCNENYLTTSVLNGSQATTATCICPMIKSILVNSCGASTSEGTDEQIVFQTGANPINIDDIVITYPSVGPYCNTTCGALTNINNAAYVTNLNTTAACGTDLFYYQDPIPANSTVIIFTGSPPSYIWDYSSICGTGPYYVVFNNNVSTTGRFANSANDNRSTTLDWGGGCNQTVTYYSSAANTGTDGDFVEFDAAGNPTYQNNPSCISGPLPISLQQFTGYREEKNTRNKLIWVTTSEINNDYFTLEKSSDGINFHAIGTVNGAGNSSSVINYSFTDYQPSNLDYYRLKQTDYDGNYSYSHTIVIKEKMNSSTIWHSDNTLHVITNKNNNPTVSLEIIDCTGRTVYKTLIHSSTEIATDQFAKGIHLIKVKDGAKFYIQKVSF